MNKIQGNSQGFNLRQLLSRKPSQGGGTGLIELVFIRNSLSPVLNIYIYGCHVFQFEVNFLLALNSLFTQTIL